MRIQPASRLSGRFRPPGDKSVSHRAAIIAALAFGRTRIENYSTSADCAATLACLKGLGVGIEPDGGDGASVTVEGAGEVGLRQPRAPLNCGNSGTTMRLLAGVLAAQNFSSVLTGDASLRSRPMRRIIEPLAKMGARISATDGCAPLVIEGQRPLTAITYRMPVKSAQVKSCILLAGLGAAGRTEVSEESGATRDHTERLLDWFGARLEKRASAERPSHSIALEGLCALRARDVSVPGDISASAFYMAAAAALPGSALEITDVGLNPTRDEIIRTLGKLGANVCVTRADETGLEAIGDLRVSGAEASARSEGGPRLLGGVTVARLIDELPVLAVFGSQLAGGLEIRDARELRVKETDRIRATVLNLRAMGARVEEYDDGLKVEGPTRLRGARLDSFGDHRIAMAFTVAALLAEGESEMKDASCVRISFPEFYTLLETLVVR